MKNRFEAGGVSEYFDEPLWQGRVITVHSSTCWHCGRITDFPSRRVMFDYVDVCRGCMKLICLGCVGKPCTPQEAECERIEREDRLKQRIEQGSWGCY